MYQSKKLLCIRLRNDESETKDKVGQISNLHFTLESCDTLKSFSLFPNVKTISKLKMEHGVELEI